MNRGKKQSAQIPPRRPQLEHVRRRSISDPLSAALLPPPNETPEQREGRLRAEQEAKKRSENIDKMLREGSKHSKKAKVIKILLLGQSESGKSTTLKQFQLQHSPADFRAERIAWRFVIYLNLLRSVRRILDAISPEQDIANNGLDELEEDELAEPASIIISRNSQCSPPPNSEIQNYDRYVKGLAPLDDLEHRLMIQLSDPDENDGQEPTHLPRTQHQWRPAVHTHEPSPHSTSRSEHGHGSLLSRIIIPTGSHSFPTTPVQPVSPTSLSNNEELSIPTTSNWKKAFALGKIQSPKNAHSGELQGWWEDPEDPVHVLNRCAPIIKEMWKDPKVRHKLNERRLRLEESSGFYLDQLDRITAKMYFPTDDDVLKARLKTTGVVEYTYTLSSGINWKIYDVGGSRNQRHAWAPYFDDVDAIIFLAPISAFDQALAEDPRVNRLEDSLILWKMVASNHLLKDVNIVLFLNKCDLLRAKLEKGVQLKRHLLAYQDRPNDYESVSKYFRNKFGAIHQSYTPNKARKLYIHLTSVIDTRSTRVIIETVHSIILSHNLKQTSLM